MSQPNLRCPPGRRPSDIGERIKQQRQRLSISQAQLARDAGIGKRTIQRVEAGAMPAADTVWRLERCLQFEPGSLVPGWKLAGSLHSGSVGARIRERRQACGISLRVLSEWVGISASSLSRLERGVSRSMEEWDLNRHVAWNLGFQSEDHLHEWLAGECKDPPIIRSY
jgi:transcriptional regulator with XRE-family HTH domain